MKKKKVLITGGAGFGGAGLTKALLERGHKVDVIDIISPNHADALRKEIDQGLIKYFWKSVHDVTPADLRNYDIVCHFAAQGDVPMGFGSPSWTAWQNVLGTIKVLEAAKSVNLEKFILPSSGNVFGRPKYSPIDEEHPMTPHNPYSASKASQELFTWAYWRAYGVPVVVFRNGIVYGPGMRRDIFIFIWLKNLLQGKSIEVQGGDQTRDPCYVTDTIDAWVAAVEAKPKDVVGEAFQVSMGTEYRVKAIADMVVRLVGRGEITYTGYRPGEKGQRECFDISKAKKVLGYEPKVALGEGLEKTWDWIQKLKF